MKYAMRRFFSDSGRNERPVYQSKLNADGTIDVKIVGYDNIQDEINSHAESCSIELIINRCTRGDFSGLSVKQGSFMDVTQLPKTYAEVLQQVIDGRNLFDSLSKEVRDRFGNDFNKWFASTGSEDWFDKMGIKEPAVDRMPSAEIQPFKDKEVSE